MLSRLLARAREQLGPQAPFEEVLARAASGLVFVDEVDKIRALVGDRPNVAGIRAQEALLTLVENEAVPLEVPPWAGGGTVTVDSRNLLFVCAGAFEGLYDAVYDRVTIGRDRGALQAVTVVEDGKVREELPFELRDWLRNEDLFDYGMSPQFVSRFDAVVLLESLAATSSCASSSRPRLGLPPEPRLLREPRHPPAPCRRRRCAGSPPRPPSSRCCTQEKEKPMPPAARVGDMHVCPRVTALVPHVGGPLMPPGGLPVLIGGLPAARLADPARCVGPPDRVVMGSATVLIGDRPAARLGDTTAHGGAIIMGCPTVLIQ